VYHGKNSRALLRNFSLPGCVLVPLPRPKRMSSFVFSTARVISSSLGFLFLVVFFVQGFFPFLSAVVARPHKEVIEGVGDDRPREDAILIWGSLLVAAGRMFNSWDLEFLDGVVDICWYPEAEELFFGKVEVLSSIVIVVTGKLSLLTSFESLQDGFAGGHCGDTRVEFNGGCEHTPEGLGIGCGDLKRCTATVPILEMY